MKGPPSGDCSPGGPRSRSTCSALVRIFAIAALAFSGWSILSYRDVLRDSKTGSVSLAAQQGKRGAAPEESSVPRPAPWHPEGCQTVVFFHIPKTGGESLNNLWKQSSRGQPRRFGWDEYSWIGLRNTGLSAEKQERSLSSLEPWTGAQAKSRHVVAELHCGDSISFMQAREAVARMRTAHERNNCGFFAFTVARPPLDWVVSLYNDICHRRLHGHKDTCPQKEDMAPKQEMLSYPHEDGMVSYLKHGWNGWSSPGPLYDSDAEDVAKSLREYLDLVAFTDEVPELRTYLTERFAAPGGVLSEEDKKALNSQSVQNANPAKKVGISDFTPEELQQLNATIQLDWRLYGALQGSHRPW